MRNPAKKLLLLLVGLFLDISIPTVIFFILQGAFEIGGVTSN
jgi:hypothetical protein